MTPQERLKLERQHQRNLVQAIGAGDPGIDNLWPKVYDLWRKYYLALIEAEWTAAINRGLPPKEVHAHLVKTKRDFLRLTEWDQLMPLQWTHCWHLRPKEMPQLRKYLNRCLTADISHCMDLASVQELHAVPMIPSANEAGLDLRARTQSRIRIYRKQCGWKQATLAEKAKISRDSVVDHESGKTRPYDDTLQNYCDAFNGKLGLQLRPIDLKEL